LRREEVLVFLTGVALAGVLPKNMLVEELDNGLTVVVAPFEASGVVAVQTWVRAGSRHENLDGYTGYAQFV